MGYKQSQVFMELFEKFDDDTDVLFYNHGKVFSLLEKYPCALIPTTVPNLTDEENEKLSRFIFSVFNQQGLTTSFLYGTGIDPIQYPPNDGKFKHSKFEPSDFLLVSDEHGEDESGRELLMFTAKVAAVCDLPWFSFTGGAFKDEVLTTVVKTKENFQVPLIKVILQNRMSDSVAKMSVPFFIDFFDTTTTPEEKFYKLSNENEVQCYLRNNELVTDWRQMR
jgi:hypothetical protein